MSGDRIRRQVYELTSRDLEVHPVWEFALDEEDEAGQDEATVRPHETDGALDPRDGMFVVRARFKLADGTQVWGYVTPPVEGERGLGTLQPVVVARGGQTPFWCGLRTPEPHELAAHYALLGKSSAFQVFPATFESDVELVGGAVVGKLEGFVVLADSSARRTVVIK
jgi:hypothetical protein